MKIIIEIYNGDVHAFYANCDVSHILVVEDDEIVGPPPVMGPFTADEITEDPRLLYKATGFREKLKEISFEDATGNSMEYISMENGIEEAWVCNCGNTPNSAGFATCLPDGTEIEPTTGSGWTKHYKCGSCGRVIEKDTLKVIAWAPIADDTDEEQTEN